MCCYTLEASFHGYFDQDRCNYEFTEAMFEDMGEHLANAIFEYSQINEEEQRVR